NMNAFASEPVTALTGEIARRARRRRIATWGVVGGALGLIIVFAGVTASRKPSTAAIEIPTQTPTPNPTPMPAPPVAPVAVEPPPAVEPPHPVLPRKAARETGASSKRQLAEARRQLAAGHFSDAKTGFSRLVDGRERAPALLGLSEIAFQQQSYADAARFAR